MNGHHSFLAMINAQLLSELEEVYYYKILPERRQPICEIWQKRMQGNQPIIDDYHRLLLTHSLCLPMAQDLQSWIKLANLCCKSNRLTMADFIFRELAHTVLADQPTLNRDLSMISPNSYTSQPSHYFNIQASATPAFSVQSQQAAYHPSLIDQQLVKYEKAKYDWHCLVAARDRLLTEKQNRRQAASHTNNDGSSLLDASLSSMSFPHSASSGNLASSSSSSTSLVDTATIKLEQNRQDQLKLIEEMKETLVKTCLPALDHLRKQVASSAGGAAPAAMMNTSGGATPGAPTANLSGAGPTVAGISQLTVRLRLSIDGHAYESRLFSLFSRAIPPRWPLHH